MNEQPIIAENEWRVILDLLEQERNELPAEIHHTDNQRVHEELEARLKLVDQLLGKVRGHIIVH